MSGKFARAGLLHKIRTLFFAFLGALGLFTAFVPQALAQNPSPITFKNTTLSIYPEYDDPLNLGYPSVLVMYDGEIVSDNLSKITFLVPSNASMYSAGSGPREQYAPGASLNRTASNVTGWDEVSFIPRTNYFVVEYYSPIQGQPDRSIPFEFRALYPVSGMKVVIQEPARSTTFKVSPEGTIGLDSEGYKIHTYNNPTLTADTPLLYNLTYSKQNTTPSKGGSSSGTSSNTTLILIVIAAIIVLGVVLFLLPQFRNNSRRSASRTQRRQAERAASKDRGKNKFCRQCGKPVKDNDRFCPSCGQPL